MMRMGSALILTPTTGSEMTAGTPQADPCQPCLLEIKPSTCIHLLPCMNGYLSLAILHQCHLTTEGQHSGFPASMRHTWSLMEAQEVFVTNTMPQRVLFTGRGLVAIFSANLCSRHALEDESYRGACTRQTSEPVSHQSSGLVVGEPQLKCVELGVPGDWSTLNNPAPGKQWAQFCMFPPPSSLHSEADNGSPFLCTQSLILMSEELALMTTVKGPRSAGYSHSHLSPGI